MRAMGMIFSNIYDSSLNELTEVRTSAAVPFAGRYRQVDFALSSMAFAGIRHIGIITKINYESLMNHLGSCEEWDLTLEDTGVVLLPPYAIGHTGIYRGKLEALHSAINVLQNAKQDYVILCGTGVIAAVDFKDALRAHIESGRDLTIITKEMTGDGTRQYALAMKADGTVPTDMVVDYAVKGTMQVSMGMFILSRKRLLEAIDATVPRGKYRLERDFVLEGFNDGSLSVNLYPFQKTALFNESLNEYYENSLRLFDDKVLKDLFHSEIPIYTKTRNEVPTFYGNQAQVSECIIADGCVLHGACRHSILFREVTVETDADLEKCVVMQGSRIGQGARLQNVILDKDVVIRPYTKLIGSEGHPLYIKKGAVV